MIPISEISGRMGNQMFQLAYIFHKVQSGEIPDIYLQDNKYIDQVPILVEKFRENIGFLSQVSIHVRRSDYVNNPFYVDLLKTDYYEKAIALFPDKQFLVFSDDPEFCKTVELFKNKDKFQIMEKTNDLADFNIMASCESNIIANSSFSWWAGYLNPNPSKVVVAPKSWYTDKVERTKCPATWTRI